MKIAPTGTLMFLLSAISTTRNVAAFTPRGLSLTRNYHRSILSLNAEQSGQNQKKQQQQQQQQGGE
jgi:hypothetical protein